MKFLTPIALTISSFWLSPCAYSQQAEKPQAKVQHSLVRVNSTLQRWNTSQPWEKTSSRRRSGLAAVISGRQILTTAEMAADATYIELENADNTRTIPAKVVAIDYERNLALLAPDNGGADDFFKELKALNLSKPAKLGDKITVWQLEDSGVPIITPATIQGVDIVSSFADGHFFLTYEAKGSMQSASNSFTLPVTKDGNLLGLLTNYDSDDQIIDIIAPEIIATFVEDASDGKYVGSPSLGIGITNTVDPSFRSWLKLPEEVGGLYITRVRDDSAAAKAGLEKGDVIIAVDGKNIGRRGYYTDDSYGRLYWSHLIRGTRNVGDTIRITYLRKGEKKEAQATLTRPGDKLIPLQTYDQAPKYLVKGGMIFQELTAAHLKAYGDKWQSKAPLNLLDAFASPEDYEKDRNRIVFLSAVIPTPATTGYERMRNYIVHKVNGKLIGDITTLIEAFNSPDSNGLHTIEFADGKPKQIYLDAAVSDMIDTELMKRGIPKLSRK